MALVVMALACGGVSVLLAFVRKRDCGRATPAVETVMLAGMLDVHLPALGIVPAPVWALMLMACAIATAFADRLRRHRGSDESRDHLHSVGMLLAAVFFLLVGSSSGHMHGVDDAGVTAVAASHVHGALGTSTIVVAASVAVAAYAYGVARALRRSPPRRMESVRRLTSLGGLVAMAAMAAAPTIG